MLQGVRISVRRQSVVVHYLSVRRCKRQPLDTGAFKTESWRERPFDNYEPDIVFWKAILY